MKCRGTISSGPRKGQPCNRNAIKGGPVCPMHGGSAPQVRAAAAVRVEIERWGLDAADTTIDPGEQLLRLLSQSSWRAEHYAAEVERMVAREGTVEGALTGIQKVINPTTGNLVEVGEFIRAMAQMEAAERDRCAKFAALAITAGLAERQTRLAEKQGALISEVLTSVFADIELTDDQRALAPAAIRRALSIAAAVG